MRKRINLVLPNCPVSPPIWDSPIGAFWAPMSRLVGVRSVPEDRDERLAYFGLDHVGHVSEGVLTLSALRVSPPTGCWQFVLSAMSTSSGIATRQLGPVSEAEFAEVRKNLPRLNTKSLTVVAGERATHGLVAETKWDFGTTPAPKIEGQSWQSFLPEGDGEIALRNFIDSGVNLLSELELNRRREDEGHPPINLLWPWGHGHAPNLPNLALLRGEPSPVVTDSLQIEGIANLVRLRCVPRSEVRRKLPTNFSRVRTALAGANTSYVVFETPGEFAIAGQEDELHWWMGQLHDLVFEPMLEAAFDHALHLTIVFPQTRASLGLLFDSERRATPGPAFRPELADELPGRDLHELIRLDQT